MNASLHVPVTLGEKAVQVDAFIDSGAQGEFIHPDLVIKLRAIPHKYAVPLIVRNVDGTPNKLGKLTHWVRIPMVVGGR